MSTKTPSTETHGSYTGSFLGGAPSSSTPGGAARLGAGLWRHRRPAGLAVLGVSAAGAVLGVLLGEHGPAVLAGIYQVARLGWPAVALVVTLVSFASMLKIVSAVLETVRLLAEQLRAGEARAEQNAGAIVRIEENQEQITLILTRIIEKTHPGTGAPVTFPPGAPQRA
jgi:hypothetical protein